MLILEFMQRHSIYMHNDLDETEKFYHPISVLYPIDDHNPLNPK